MGRITLLRHTMPAVTPGTCYGRTDLGLSDTFHTEAQTALATLPVFDVLISSPLQRCQSLAGHIAQATGTALQIAPLWTEMDFGNWEGTAWSDINRTALDAWAADILHYNGHGGETVAQMRTRVATALADLPDARCLIVTHMGCIKAARHLTGDPHAWEYSQPFGSHTVLPSSV
ncbi:MULTISPECIES: alpha-ribazole phosphatase family protein [unclassified Marinovum]